MQFRKDVAIYIPGRAVGYGMAYCVHTICIETGFKLHFAPTRHQFKHQKTCKHTLAVNELFQFQWKSSRTNWSCHAWMICMCFICQITKNWYIKPPNNFIIKRPTTIIKLSLQKSLRIWWWWSDDQNRGCNLCGKLGNHSDILPLPSFHRTCNSLPPWWPLFCF